MRNFFARLRANRRTPLRGQSMLEGIVATGIMMTAVSAALTLVSSSINAEKQSENLLVAGNLAREGVEAVRMLRDSNWLAGNDWDSGLSSGLDYTGVPSFDPATNSWSILFTPNVIGDDAGAVYRYSTGAGNAVVGLMVQRATKPAETVVMPFRRLVTIDPLCDDGAGSYAVVTSGDECGAATKIGMRVTSQVQWSAGKNVHSITVEERLFNWR